MGIRSIRAWDAAVAEGGLGGGGDLRGEDGPDPTEP